ncbi:MAG: hypothetical protein OJI67_10070, partial [Prosthecobacter sp.]|nr:hypothetical protein [Prosthecobacter sp.]
SQVTSRIANITQAEYNTLVSFFFSTNGLEWTNNTNWLQQSVSPCQWFGVTCTSGGNHVMSLCM